MQSRLKRAADHAHKNYATIDHHIGLIQRQSEQPLNLDGFKQIPPLYEVSIPPSYITRLKVIYNVAARTIHKTDATITTRETSPNQFEAFLTIQDSTYRYSDVPHQNAASVEAAAIYYSLKQMTNLLGYQIIDMNYPILSEVITAINNLSLQVGLQQCCVSYITADITQIYESLGHLLNDYSMAAYDIQNMRNLDNATTELDNTIANYYNSIEFKTDYVYVQFTFLNKQTISITCTHIQIQFLCTSFNSEPLINTPSRWIDISKPGMTAPTTNPSKISKRS